jgi:hypothetical protein
VVESGANAKGDVAGSVQFEFSGAYSGTRSLGFAVVGGKLTIFWPKAPFSDSFGAGVNERGQVIGYFNYSSAVPNIDDPTLQVEHGFLWSSGSISDVGPANHLSIDGHGDLAGWYRVDGHGSAVNGYDVNHENPRAFLIRNGKQIPLGSWKATGISDAGTVVGFEPHNVQSQESPNGFTITTGFDSAGAVPIIWRNGLVKRLSFTGWHGLEPLSINSAEDIVGVAQSGDSEIAFLVHDGICWDLASLVRGAKKLTSAFQIDDARRVRAIDRDGNSLVLRPR